MEIEDDVINMTVHVPMGPISNVYNMNIEVIGKQLDAFMLAQMEENAKVGKQIENLAADVIYQVNEIERLERNIALMKALIEDMPQALKDSRSLWDRITGR